MKCHCGLDTKVLRDARMGGDRRSESPTAHVSSVLNIPERVRECPVGHRTKTYELDGAELARLRALAYRALQGDAWLQVGQPALDGNELRRQRTEQLRPLVLADLQAGLTRERIAVKHRTSRGTVRKIEQAARSDGTLPAW